MFILPIFWLLFLQAPQKWADLMGTFTQATLTWPFLKSPLRIYRLMDEPICRAGVETRRERRGLWTEGERGRVGGNERAALNYICYSV